MRASHVALLLVAALVGGALMLNRCTEAPEQAAVPKAADATPRPEAGRVANPPYHALHVEVLKAKRRLVLYDGAREVRSYRAALGTHPAGTKEMQGDGKTPEGTFYVCMKNPRSKYYLSFGLSYPGVQDAARGLAAGLISQQDHDRIVRAIAAQQAPPWDTKLGGEICIHGRGSARDWTIGCVALDDADMAELYAAVPYGTEVVIKP